MSDTLLRSGVALLDLRWISRVLVAAMVLCLACSDAAEKTSATQAPPIDAATQSAAPSSTATTAAPPTAAGEPVAPTFSVGDVEAIVSPVALYPDPLLAVSLQAATQPIQLVEAQRFLARRQQDPSAAPSPDWDKSVVALLNYPDVVAMISGSPEWTESLGSAAGGSPAPADPFPPCVQITTKMESAFRDLQQEWNCFPDPSL